MSDILDSLRSMMARRKQEAEKNQALFYWAIKKLHEINQDDGRWVVNRSSPATCELVFSDCTNMIVIRLSLDDLGVRFTRGWRYTGEAVPSMRIESKECGCAHAIESIMHEFILHNNITL